MLNRSNLPILLEQKHLPEDFPCSCMQYTQRYRSSPTLHYHDCLEIGRCISGSGMMFVDGKVHSFSSGSLSILPAGCVHDSSISMSGPDETPSVWRFVFADPAGLGVPISAAADVVVQPRLTALFDLIYAVSTEDGPRDEIRHLLHAMALEMHRPEEKSARQRSPWQKQILLAQHRIAMEYASSLTVEGLAQACSMSVSSFRRHFTAVVGMSPQQYLIETRLSVAEHLIRNTSDKLIVIAGKAGFRTLSSFNRLFLQYRGHAPGKLR